MTGPASTPVGGDGSRGPSRDPRWLDDEERAAWVGLNGLLIKLPGLLDGELARDHGLTFFEYMVLAMLSESPDHSLRMSWLAVLTNGSQSRLSHVAKRLERQGFIRRERDATDRRSTHAIITPAGMDKVRSAAPDHVAAVREYVLDHLDRAQLAQLAGIGDAILENIDPEGAARPER